AAIPTSRHPRPPPHSPPLSLHAALPIYRPPELAAQERQEGREPPRRHAILQLREHLDVLRGQDVGARAHELADLDGQTLEARGEPVGALGAAAMMARQAHAVAARPLDQLVAAVDARDERCESGEP